MKKVHDNGSVTTTDYLIDPSNHTGYTQVLREKEESNATVYTIGHDVLAQVGSTMPKYFLYDGHGSVRHLTEYDNDGQAPDTNGDVLEDYHFDGYGNQLAISEPNPSTKLLYTGEMVDSHLDFIYLRARWYNPANGRFNRMDPFAGSNTDPQSLHKYLYAHANPVNMIDPSGNFGIAGVALGIALVRMLVLISIFAIVAATALYVNYGQKTNVLKEPYLSYIKSSAVANRLTPEFLAAIIVTEQNALNVWDAFGDVPGAMLGRNTSIGLGQIQVNRAIEFNLVDTTDRSEVISRLRNPELNIEATARFLRIMADMAEDSGAQAGYTTYLGVRLADYKLDGSQWDYNNDNTVILMGSEYTSAPWDFVGYQEGLDVYEYWGELVLSNYREIVENGYFD